MQIKIEMEMEMEMIQVYDSRFNQYIGLLSG